MKRIKVLIIILCILVLGLVCMLLTNNNDFKKPSFESNAIVLKDNSEYIDKVLTIKKGYSLFIEGNPKYENGYLYINFYVNTDDNIFLKVRILDKDEIIGESGLLKTGEFLEKVKVKPMDYVGKELTYLIMGYEKDTYYSAGEVKLTVKVGDNNE